MNDILKQRLVGALILLALGVVFWPIIFVEPGDRAGEAPEVEIPPRPSIATTPLETPDLVGLRPSEELQSRRELAEEERDAVAADSGNEPELPAHPMPVGAPTPGVPGKPPAELPAEPAGASQPDRPPPGGQQVVTRTRSEAPVSPAIDAEGVPVAWILQVVSVSSADKAESLRRQLLDMGHKAYVKKIRRGDKSLYRVYIGPKFERARLEDIKPTIDSAFAVESLVVRYLP